MSLKVPFNPIRSGIRWNFPSVSAGPWGWKGWGQLKEKSPFWSPRAAGEGNTTGYLCLPCPQPREEDAQSSGEVDASHHGNRDGNIIKMCQTRGITKNRNPAWCGQTLQLHGAAPDSPWAASPCCGSGASTGSKSRYPLGHLVSHRASVRGIPVPPDQLGSCSPAHGHEPCIFSSREGTAGHRHARHLSWHRVTSA